MENLKQKTGTSILFITHDLGVVAEVCDDVVVMYSGRVVEKGDVRSIFAIRPIRIPGAFWHPFPSWESMRRSWNPYRAMSRIQNTCLRDVNSLPDAPAPLISAGRKNPASTMWEEAI